MKINQHQIQLSHKTLYKEYSCADESILSMISLKAPVLVVDKEEERPPVDVVAVIDISGSMCGEKLETAKKTLAFMAKELGPQDRFGVVSFSDEARVELPLTNLNSDTNRALATTKINALRDEGCTNLAGGLEYGIRMLKDSEKDANEVRAVLLLTDGHANRGETSTEGILTMMNSESKRTSSGSKQGFFSKIFSSSSSSSPTQAKDTSFSVHTFGFGSDHDSNMLKAISDSAHGTYFYIGSSEQIAEAFINCVGGLTSSVASNIRLTVEALSGCTISKVWSGYRYNTLEDKKKYEIILHDLQSEETRDVLFELAAPKCSEADDVPLIKADLTYKNLILKDEQNCSTQILGFATRKVTPEKDQTPDEDVGENFQRLKSAEVIKQASELGNRGDYTGAKNLLGTALNDIQHQAYAGKCDYLMENMEDLAKEMESPQMYEQGGMNRVNNILSGQMMQRSAGVMSKKANAKFSNKKREKMLGKFFS